MEFLQIQNVVKVALTGDCHYWKPRFPESRYSTVSFQAMLRKNYRRRRSSTSAKESFLDTSQHTITPSRGGARFGHASWPDSKRALRTAVSISKTLRIASAPCSSATFPSRRVSDVRRAISYMVRWDMSGYPHWSKASSSGQSVVVTGSASLYALSPFIIAADFPQPFTPITATVTFIPLNLMA